MKKYPKRIICLLLSAVLLVCALPITVYADDVTVINVGTAAELTNACSTINAGSGGEYLINLTDDITNGYIDISKAGAEVTIVGNNHTIACPYGNSMINISNGAVVNLGDGNSALTLSSGSDGDVPGIVYVLGGGSVCNMYNKVTLKDHQGNNYLGGGVTVEGGTFRMYGGTIQNCGIDGGSVCYGGGVAVFSGGTFEMNGGTIKDCYADSSYRGGYNSYAGVGGGVLVTDYSTFTMRGGTIDGNTATYFGGGVAFMASLQEIFDHQKYGVTGSQFNLSGGTISGNEADMGAGIFASGWLNSGRFPIAGSNQFGSAPDDPGLNITGGTITENEAASDGGGVCIFGIRPDYQVNVHNARITDNKAVDGAGLEVNNYWTEADIDLCTITGNMAENNGGGVALFGNSSSSGTLLKNTAITGNTSGNRGAGVYYDADSKLTISGANTIEDNTYNDALNNLNIYRENDTVYPVYVSGDLTGSQIGLSDPRLWDDNLADDAEEAVSEDYLTSGYNTYNSAAPDTLFTSDHETWSADFSDVNENEVRLIRNLQIDYHINNDAIANESYDGEDLFTEYVNQLAYTVKVGDTIEAFYQIPVHDTGYLFKGWYYDPDNENDDHPVQFGTDKYKSGKDIYAHWIKVEDVDKDDDDPYSLPAGETAYGGFDLTGIQIRREATIDTNFGYEHKPGGMRFMTSLSMNVVDKINAIKANNIEYGYVAATREDWINYHIAKEHKLLYVSDTANGVNTNNPTEDPEDYFGFAKIINCTSKQANRKNGVVYEDHRNYSEYLLYTLVITYENEGEEAYDKKVLARPYIRYTDANGLERVAYTEYRGTNVLGGCYTSYNAVMQ